MPYKKKTNFYKKPSQGKNRKSTQVTARSFLSKKIIFVSIVLFATVGSWLLYRSFAINNTASTFRHPGILVSDEQLTFIRNKVNAGEEPWLSAYNQMRSSSLASRTYTPRPVPELRCNTSSYLDDRDAEGNLLYPQLGCVDINNDSSAVYTQALMYKITGDTTYANNAIRIMNAWSSTLRSVPFDDTRFSNNDSEYWQNRLILGWSAQSMVRGAEIIRYTTNLWQSSDIARFESMLNTHYVPQLSQGWTAGWNDSASWAEGLVNIGVFTNNRTVYDRGIQHWKWVAKAMFYVTEDGAQPPYYFTPRTNNFVSATPELNRRRFNNPSQYINGLQVETCRDLGHAFMGIGGIANVAETALLQGTHDLYSDPEFRNKLISGYELNTGYVNQMLDRMAATGTSAQAVSDSTWMPTNFPCADFKWGGNSAYLGTEIAYNHYANRLGISMPNTKRLAERTRVTRGGNHLWYETLTHANSGRAGLTTTPTPPPSSTPTTPTQPVEPTDTKAPTVVVTSPSNGQTVSGTITLSANASDESGIKQVDLRVNNTSLSMQVNAPYSISYDTKALPNGQHALTAVAYDNKGNTSTSSVTFTVNNVVATPTPPADTQPPSTPTGLVRELVANWGRARYDLRLSWQPSTDNVGVKEYVVTRDGTLLGTTTSRSFTDSSVSAGRSYTYSVVARDAVGNTSGQAVTSAKANCFWFICSLE